MNDIYWHDKRTMPSRQLSSPPPTQPRRSHENTLRTKHYQQMNIQLNSHSITDRPSTSPYIQHPTVINRSHNTSRNFAYPSSLYGVYRQSPSTIINSSTSSQSNQNGLIDLRNETHRSQPRQLSRSVNDDYYTTKYEELNGLYHEMYDDEEENGDDGDDENSSEIFKYTFNDTGSVQ